MKECMRNEKVVETVYKEANRVLASGLILLSAKMTYPKLICLLALLPIIFSLPTPPVPTDPGIEIEVTTKGLTQFTNLIQPDLLKLHEPVPLRFELDSKTYEGTFHVTNYPKVQLKPVPNNRATVNYDDFESVDEDSISADDDRFKRDTGKGHAKVIWEDKDFLAEKQLGGLETTLDGLDITFNLKRGDEKVDITGSDVTLKVVTILGQDEGQLKQGRIAAELQGELEIEVEGKKIDLTEAQKNTYYEKILELIVKRYHHEFEKEVTLFKQVIGSNHLPHVIFDFRVTEHPEFTESGLKLKLAGKFVYDKDSKYKFSTIGELEEYLSFKRYVDTFKTENPQPITVGSDGFTKTYTLMDTTETPEIDTLKTEIDQKEEAKRKTLSDIKMTISEDFLNSIIQTLIESGYLDYSFTKEKLDIIFTLAELDKSLVPSGDLRLKIEPVEGHKYFKFSEGKLVEHFKVAVDYDGKKAIYDAVSESHLLFGHKKIATDITKLVVTKKADAGFPELFDEQTLQTFFKSYYHDLKTNIPATTEFEYLTQLDLTDKHFTVGLTVEDVIKH